MERQPNLIEQLLLAILAADDERRMDALRVLRGESEPSADAQAMAGPLLLHMGQAAKQLGVSRATLWRLIREGRIERVEMRRGSFAIRKAELVRFVTSQQFGKTKKAPNAEDIHGRTHQ